MRDPLLQAVRADRRYGRCADYHYRRFGLVIDEHWRSGIAEHTDERSGYEKGVTALSFQ